MNHPFNNQVMLGKREWAILTENNKPYPVTHDNRPLTDEPLLIKEERRPSAVDFDYNEGENIIGHMGEDEDIEQAQYNIMSQINKTVGGLNDRLNQTNKAMRILYFKNKENIDNLLQFDCQKELDARKCNEEQTLEGCTKCVDHWTNDAAAGKLSPICKASPYCKHEKNSISVAHVKKCNDLGHFDCHTVISDGVDKYQNNTNTLCVWDDNTSLFGPSFHTSPRKTNIKCRNLCYTYSLLDSEGRPQYSESDARNACRRQGVQGDDGNTCLWDKDKKRCHERKCKNSAFPTKSDDGELSGWKCGIDCDHEEFQPKSTWNVRRCKSEHVCSPYSQTECTDASPCEWSSLNKCKAKNEDICARHSQDAVRGRSCGNECIPRADGDTWDPFYQWKNWFFHGTGAPVCSGDIFQHKEANWIWHKNSKTGPQ